MHISSSNNASEKDINATRIAIVVLGQIRGIKNGIKYPVLSHILSFETQFVQQYFFPDLSNLLLYQNKVYGQF